MATEKKEYIDAVRGWAIILVITCHVSGMFSEMPYPIKKFTNFGWHGVQMFFLASALTLLMSWYRQERIDLQSFRKFFIRRFLRIAPMYYFGAFLYFFFDPPVAGFDIVQALRTFAFINAWHPDWLSTTGNWSVVPGGWSIGVEFTFYFFFPFLTLLVVSLPRSFIFFFLAVAMAIIMEPIGEEAFREYGEVAVRNFLYFWFFNQLPIFALGFILYFALQKTDVRIASTRLAYALLLSIGLCCLILSQNPLSGRFSPTVVPPTFLVASLLFMAFIFVLARAPATLFTHPYVRRMGVLSFSSYVLHFLFVYKLPIWTGGLIDIHATSYAAIGNGVLLWIATMTCTVLASHLTYRLIEEPGISLAHRITSSRRVSAQADRVIEGRA